MLLLTLRRVHKNVSQKFSDNNLTVVEEFPLNLAHSTSDSCQSCVTFDVKIIHFTWCMYAHYLVKLL